MVHAITGADKPGKEAQAESVQWEVRAADFPNYPPTSGFDVLPLLESPALGLASVA